MRTIHVDCAPRLPAKVAEAMPRVSRPMLSRAEASASWKTAKPMVKAEPAAMAPAPEWPASWPMRRAMATAMVARRPSVGVRLAQGKRVVSIEMERRFRTTLAG